MATVEAVPAVAASREAELHEASRVAREAAKAEAEEEAAARLADALAVHKLPHFRSIG